MLTPTTGTIEVLGGHPASGRNSLDPLARREFLQDLMAHIADNGTTVVLSSHLVSDLERACDYLIVLCASRVRLAGEVEHLLATHRRLTGPKRDPASLPAQLQVITASHTQRQSTLIAAPKRRSTTRPGPWRNSAWRTWSSPT